MHRYPFIGLFQAYWNSNLGFRKEGGLIGFNGCPPKGKGRKVFFLREYIPSIT